MLPAADHQPQSSLVPSPLRATGIVGLGSVAALLLSVAAAKAYALLLGPEGVGLLALMQSIMIVGVMVASAGLATSAVRAIATASETGGSEARAVARSAAFVGLVGGGIGAMIVVVFRESLAELVLGDLALRGAMVILAVALGLAVAASVQLALLTGLHRVRQVVVVNVGTSAAAAVFGIALVAAFGQSGLAPGLLVTAAVQLALSRVLATRALRSFDDDPDRHQPGRRSGQLVVTGLPVALGQLAGSGALFLVPVVVLQVLQTAEVGYYRAAAAISIGYLTFFLAALTQDFYPRLARTTDRVELGLLVERRMRLLMALGVPVIVGLLAVGPLLVEVLYTSEFAPAYDVLQWQLIGDLIRLPAWVFVFVLLARGGPWPYVGAELAGGLSLLVGTYVGLIVVGLVGSGVGYAASQLVYYLAAVLLARRYVATTPGRLQGVVMGTAAVASVVIVSPLALIMKSALLGTAAILFAAAAWPRLYGLHRRGEL